MNEKKSTTGDGFSKNGDGDKAAKATAVQGPSSKNVTHVSCLLPEVLVKIFDMLDVADKCRCALVCVDWRNASYQKKAWQNTTVRFVCKTNWGNPTLCSSLARRGVQRLQVVIKTDEAVADCIEGIAPILPNVTHLCFWLTLNVSVGKEAIFSNPTIMASVPSTTEIVLVSAKVSCAGVEMIIEKSKNLSIHEQ